MVPILKSPGEEALLFDVLSDTEFKESVKEASY